MDLWVYRCRCGTLHRVAADVTEHTCPDCGQTNVLQDGDKPEKTVVPEEGNQEPDDAVITAPATNEGD